MISKEQLHAVLIEFKWDVPAAADYIGLSYSSTYKRMKKYGIERPEDFPKKNWNGGKTHCKRGHEFTLENTFPNEFGYRKCRECDRGYRKESNGPVILQAVPREEHESEVQLAEAH